MANVILGNSLVSGALSTYNDFTSSEIFTSELNKLWRAKILLDRVTRPAKTGATNSVPLEAKLRKQNILLTPRRQTLPPASENKGGREYKPVEQGFNVGANERFKDLLYHAEEVQFKYEKDDGTEAAWGSDIVSQNHQAAKESNQIILYNFLVSPVQYIVLQTVPREIEYQGESTWAVIHSMGRNTPMYHFTGAETTIQMNVSWYCTDKAHPEEVVAKCRLLEAWTKANAYLASPPVLKIQWGRSDLFKDQYFILTAATYKLSNWRASAKVRRRNTHQFEMPAGYVDPAMYPSTATQELILKRVSANNLSHNDIIPQAWVDGVHGINSGSDNPNQLV